LRKNRESGSLHEESTKVTIELLIASEQVERRQRGSLYQRSIVPLYRGWRTHLKAEKKAENKSFGRP
jgi:hypothetical protein